MTINQTEPTPNLPLLRKVLDHIGGHPEHLNMGNWLAGEVLRGREWCFR